MSPVIEALPPKKSSTSSNYCDEWLDFLDEDASIVRIRQVEFPDLSMNIVERPDGNWVLVNSDTSVSGRFVEYLEPDVIDDIESSVMFPKRKVRISVKVRSIKKGRPSVCDEVEYEQQG